MFPVRWLLISLQLIPYVNSSITASWALWILLINIYVVPIYTWCRQAISGIDNSFHWRTYCAQPSRFSSDWRDFEVKAGPEDSTWYVNFHGYPPRDDEKFSFLTRLAKDKKRNLTGFHLATSLTQNYMYLKIVSDDQSTEFTYWQCDSCNLFMQMYMQKLFEFYKMDSPVTIPENFCSINRK